MKQSNNEKDAFDNLADALIYIQQNLIAPKDLWNEFSGFPYRNAEGILRALKPLLLKTGCRLLITNDIIDRAGKTYIKATATLKKGDESESVDAYAWEAHEKKKGNDSAQMTGACISYAKKYALCGLFALDDSKDDPDTKDNRDDDAQTVPEPAQAVEPLTQEETAQIRGAQSIKELNKICKRLSKANPEKKGLVLKEYTVRAEELQLEQGVIVE